MKWPARGSSFDRACTAALVLASTLLFGGCSSSENGASTVRDPAAQAVEVVAAEATLRPLGVEIEAVGTAAANESVEVTSEVSKKVTAIRFDEGDRVRRGDVLVELDSDEVRAAVAEAEATLADAESQYRRSQNLFTREALSSAQLDQIESALKASRARVQAARARLADTVIRAGFDGRTGFRRVSVGTLVGPNTVITTLDDDSLIKLNFTVSETVLFLIRQGMPISAATPGIPGRKFAGRVTHLDSRVDPVTRSIVVRAELPNPDGLLRPGMFMTVSLQGDVVAALLVPEAAIVAERGRSFVFVVRDGAVERREVTTSRRRPGEVQVTAGLEEHERVVVEGTQNLRDGMRVAEQARSAAAGT
jgi:membrane fusion protein, multidrug efflux system